jgi:hypothetical protein
MPDPTPSAPKKRRGPNTPEGKARSAMNALKHGLRARRFFLLPEEDPAEFSSFVADIRSAYTPEDAVELGQVEAIAVAMWREIRADRIEGETMALNKPANKEQSHGTDLYRRQECVALTTALRYRTQAQMETRRATDLFWRHRKARLAGLLEAPAEAAEAARAPAAEPASCCTNEFPPDPPPPAATPEPPPAAGPEPAPAAAPEPRTDEFPIEALPPGMTVEAVSALLEACTKEFLAAEKARDAERDPEDLGLLAEYRALKKTSATRAWLWLQGLPPAQLARLQALAANEPGLDLVAR